jgi:integrase
MTTILLTPELIESRLECPPGKSKVELCDTKTTGLRLEVSATGKKTYFFSHKQEGKRTHHRLGSTDEITLDQARAMALAIRARTQSVQPPSGQGARSAITVDVFFEKHYLPFVKPRKRSWKRDEELYRLRIKPAFGHKRLDELTRQEVQALQASVLAEDLAPATADHHVKLIRQALNLAVDWDMLDKNPASGVKLFRVDNRLENYLDETQLGRLLHVLRTDENRAVCNIALFLLSTGCRLNEALQATWPQIDRGTRVWRIPAKNSKSRRIRSVPLNDSALEVIAGLGTEGSFEHLFVNRRTGQPYANIAKAWYRIRTAAGLPKLRLHDLRHQFASMLVNAGRSLYEVQAVLGHADSLTTQRYAHLSSKSLQDAANSASVAIRGASSTAKVPA